MRKAGGAIRRKQAQETRRIGDGADRVERPAEKQSIEDQERRDGDEQNRHDRPHVGQGAFRGQRAEAREHQHAGDQHRGRDGRISQRHHEMGDEPDFDHDVARAETGEVNDGQELAARAREDGPPAPDQGNDQKHGRGQTSDAERRPDQEIAPLVLQQLEPVEHARQVSGFHISGEVRRIVGERARIEHVAIRDLAAIGRRRARARRAGP